MTDKYQKARKALDLLLAWTQTDRDDGDFRTVHAALDAGKKAEARITQTEADCDMRLENIAPTLNAHRITAEKDNARAEKAEAELNDLYHSCDSCSQPGRDFWVPVGKKICIRCVAERAEKAEERVRELENILLHTREP